MISSISKIKSKDNCSNILPVLRSKEEAKETYDKISKFYDYTEEIFEKKYINMAIRYLDIKKGDVVLEIGFGTGNALIKIAEYVGESGHAYGIDISPKMVEKTNIKIKNKLLQDRIKLTVGDALRLPYSDSKFSVVFISFTLELFDTPEIPMVLKEVNRVLKKGGRLGVVSLSKENGNSLFLRLYEWAHIKFPKYIDCRPIFVCNSIEGAGFNILFKKKTKIFLAPIEIVIGLRK
ncbi:MAG: methyltransferase domain-containing protein [Actinobacteria bacterium]|nr:methyltransferase domain-containing protein [Actinomycetota bacterium]MBM3713721.1 methyltransferase domain-containing protein [Actinomycetota bacterium]